MFVFDLWQTLCFFGLRVFLSRMHHLLYQMLNIICRYYWRNEPGDEQLMKNWGVSWSSEDSSCSWILYQSVFVKLLTWSLFYLYLLDISFLLLCLSFSKHWCLLFLCMFLCRFWDYSRNQPLLDTVEHHSEFVCGLDLNLHIPNQVTMHVVNLHINRIRSN